MGTPEKGTSELHPHFPCEGTPSHADSCDQPKPLAEDVQKMVEAVREGLKESSAYFAEVLNFAYNGSAQAQEDYLDAQQPAGKVVPPPTKSGVMLKGPHDVDYEILESRQSLAV